MKFRTAAPLVPWLLATACATPTADGVLELPDGRTAAKLQSAAYDGAQHDATCKVWHDVFSPGGTLLTKGLGGQHPHHRGLFVGWNRIRIGEATRDVWHCTAGVSQRWRQQLSPASHDLGAEWQVQAIDWCDAAGQPFVHERRGLRVEAVDDTAFVLHMDVLLRAAHERVLLRGDPQHAGIQFRALQQFAEPGATPVRYVRPASAKAQDNDVWTGCEWIAAVLPLATGAVTVLRVEHADNPTATWSTRAYGRFGATYDLDLDADRAKRLRVDWVIADGERDATWCEQLAKALRL